MRMPFGKFKGEQLEDIPTSYLYWLASEGDKWPDLQQEAENQLKLREGVGVVRPQEKF